MSDYLSIGKSVAHESAHLHVSGEAHYIDDIPEPRNTLYAAIGKSTQAHARIKHIDLARVRAAPGVVDVITAADLPGDNDFGSMVADDPLLAEAEVLYAGQPVFVVVALDIELARKAALLADIDYEPLPAVLNVRQAMDCGSLLQPPNRMQRGEPESALLQAPHRLSGEIEIGGQEQFYLEGHIALAIPREDGCMHVYSSTQHPDEVQHKVAARWASTPRMWWSNAAVWVAASAARKPSLRCLPVWRRSWRGVTAARSNCARIVMTTCKSAANAMIFWSAIRWGMTATATCWRWS